MNEIKYKYHDNGNIQLIEYLINNLYHREDGPAFIEYNKKRKFKREYWINKGIHYTIQVNEWLEENNLNWQEMNENQFNQMWLEIL